MVRSSSTKTSSEKKTDVARSSKASGTKKSVSVKSATAGQTAGKAAKGKATEKVSSKAKASTTSAGTKAKETKGATATPKASAVKPSKALSKKPSASARSTPAPRTPELFEESSKELDIPNVSVLPELADEPIDQNQADIEAKTPPEFREMDGMFAEQPSPAPVPTALAAEVADVTFSYLGFSDQILEAIRKQNFDKPTRVQALCLPFTLDGKDVAGFAQTGTGKTAVYLLTAAHKLLNQENRQLQPHRPHALVVVPTRELADQVTQDAKRLLSGLKLKSLAVFGGVDIERHISELSSAIDLVVATPGRLLDLHRSKKLELDDLQLLVIDECDRMFDMGFIDDVEYILRHLPAERVQKLLFSATGSEKVKELAFEYLDEPEYIETDPVRITPEKITQVAYAVTAEQKFLTLMGHIKANNPECGIIFTNTKVVAEWVGYKLSCNGLSAEVLTGDLPQRKRLGLIKKIKEGKCNLLVATDVLSRGLHVANLSHVYNFDVPDDAESFIHRIGRTARAGATGHAITLICDDYGFNMGAVEKLLGFSIPLAPVPNSYLALEDASDYPFDNTGRIKSFGQTYGGATQDGTQDEVSQARSGSHQERRDSRGPSSAQDRHAHRTERPEPTLPHHPRRDSGHGNRPTTARPANETRIESSTEIPVAAAKPTQPTASHKLQQQQVRDGFDAPQPMPKHRTPAPAPQGQGAPQRSGPVPQGTSTHAHSQSRSPQPQQPQHQTSSHASVRRDEKARETIDLAIQAAKKAAARRQGHGPQGSKSSTGLGKPAKGRVTEQIDEFAAAVLTGAQEKLGGTFGNLQDRFVNRLEETFPRLSETLVRLGFFSKRFTDDR